VGPIPNSSKRKWPEYLGDDGNSVIRDGEMELSVTEEEFYQSLGFECVLTKLLIEVLDSHSPNGTVILLICNNWGGF
jgi:hypothetical protein